MVSTRLQPPSGKTGVALPVAPKGNTYSVTHGATRPELLSGPLPPVAQAIYTALAETLPYLETPDYLLLELLARTIYRYRLVEDYLDRLGGSLIDAKGRARGCTNLYLNLQKEIRATAAALGISPTVRAGLMANLSSSQRDRAAARAADELRERHARRDTIPNSIPNPISGPTTASLGPDPLD